MEKQSLTYYNQLAQAKGGRCLSTEYINALTKYGWECKGRHRWEATAGDVQFGYWCPKCAGSDKKNLEYYDRFAQAKGGRCLSTEYINALTKYGWECKEGHRWRATANDIKSGYWCPKCPHKQSQLEKVVFDLIQSRFLDAQARRRGVLHSRGLELDIYVPSLKKAIEFDGDFWHKSPWALLHGQAERDARKDQQCKEVGIDLLRIGESDYKKNPDTEMSKIWQFLGVIQ